VWINAPIAQYVAALKNIETFETGASFRKTRRIGVPPRIEDFADLALTDEDVADLARCRVGACDIKLTDRAIETFQREVDWRRSEAGASANVVLRQVLVDYLRGYLEGGNGRLAVYRDRTPPTSVGHEIATLVDSMPALSALPDVRDYLLNFPRASLPDSTSMLYWQETAFGLKPTHRLSHLVVRERADEAVVASKMLYATHYFWTALELRLLVADPSRGSGFWFLTAARSRMDGLTGFTGFFVRRRVRSEVLEGTQRMLVATRRTIERRVDTSTRTAAIEAAFPGGGARR
jgi:hypothetical protein